MNRTLELLGAAVVLGALACGRADEPSEPASVLVVGDSVGRLVSPAVPSPDGTRIAYAQVVNGGRSSIFVSAPDGSNGIQVSHGVWDTGPVWSPDGKWIAYQGEDPLFDLHIVPADGSGPARQLTSGPPLDTPSQWLNDGGGVLVNRGGAGYEHPVLIPINGGPERRIGPVMRGDLHGAWSPSGAQFGFDLHQGGSITVWVQDSAAGSTPRQLTSEGFENAPASAMWSPDGKQILYTSRRTGTLDIYVLDLESGQSRQLTSDIRDDFGGRFSPDGRWIVFISDRGGQRDLWLMPSAGGQATRLTNDTAVESNPRWDTDGKSIHYMTSQISVELQMVPVAGGAARTLRAWDDYNIVSADLSPDGKTVIFHTDRVGNGDVFTMPVEGGEPVLFGSSTRTDQFPRYSPDGSLVAMQSDRAGSSLDIWVVSVGTGESRNLTAGPGDEGEIAWSPDAKKIAYASNRDASNDLWVVPVSGGSPSRLTTLNLRPTQIEWSPDSRYLYFMGDKPGAAGGRDYFRVSSSGGRPESLGAKAGIGTPKLSRDGTRVTYSTYERGWAFVHVMPSTGGASTVVTTDTTNVYHAFPVWARGDSLLVVVALDLAGNRDAAELYTYRLSDGRWNRLTRTSSYESPVGFTPDGKEILTLLSDDRRQLRRVPVGPLVAGREQP